MAHWGGALLLAAVTRGRLRQLCGHALRYWFEVCVDDSESASGLSDGENDELDAGLAGLDEDGGLPLATAPPGGSLVLSQCESLAASAFGCAPTAASPRPGGAVVSTASRRAAGHPGLRRVDSGAQDEQDSQWIGEVATKVGRA